MCTVPEGESATARDAGPLIAEALTAMGGDRTDDLGPRLLADHGIPPSHDTVRAMRTVRIEERSGLQRNDTLRRQVRPLEAGARHAGLTVLQGEAAGDGLALTRARTIIGRARDADLFVDDPGVSRLHAAIERQVGGGYLLRDLDSTNGTFVGGVAVHAIELVSGDRIQLGPDCVLRFNISDELEDRLRRQLYESSMIDAVTQVANHRALVERLKAEVAYAVRAHEDLSLLMMDLDRFKDINDGYGHLAGDAVLHAMAQSVRSVIRAEDLLGRYGGDEFLLIARATGHEAAVNLADRVLLAIAGARVAVEMAVVTPSASIGVASLSELGPDPHARRLVALADARLYRAKRGGRGRLCAEG